MPCEDSISAMVARGVKRLWALEQTASVRTGADVSAGIALSGTAGIASHQCSARSGAAPAGTSSISALTRVVSGWEAQKRQQETRPRGKFMLCPFTTVDRAFVGGWEKAYGIGSGCDNAREALDHFIHQWAGTQLRHSGGVESASTS